MVHHALLLSAPALELDRLQLPGQLLGRFVYWDSKAWGDLPDQIRAWAGYAWLQPLQPTLTPAGGALLMSIKAHQEFFTAVLLTDDKRHLITSGNRDPVVKVWDFHNGRLLRELSGGGNGITATVLLSDNTSLVTGDVSGRIRRWDDSGGEMKYESDANSAPILGLALDNEENTLCASSEDGRVTILDPEQWCNAAADQCTQNGRSLSLRTQRYTAAYLSWR